MAKLNIKAYSEKGKAKSISGNSEIVIDLNYKNTTFGRLSLKLEEVNNKYFVYFYPITEVTGRGGRVLLHEEEISKGNKQKDKCYKCKSTDEGLTEQDDGKLACDNCHS